MADFDEIALILEIDIGDRSWFLANQAAYVSSLLPKAEFPPKVRRHTGMAIGQTLLHLLQVQFRQTGQKVDAVLVVPPMKRCRSIFIKAISESCNCMIPPEMFVERLIAIHHAINRQRLKKSSDLWTNKVEMRKFGNSYKTIFLSAIHR